MDSDPLDSEVSASLDLTETGLKANAKSRAISGIDRLLGNITELVNIPLEERHALRRERLSARMKIERAATEVMIDQIKADPDVARRAIEGNLSQSLRRLENKEVVAKIALEQLELSPPLEEQERSGPEELSQDFLNAFERHAEDASTEELRHKWASVLAAEIKQPGTFTKKAMRILDEISTEVASAFAEACRHRVGDSVPMCIHDPDFLMSGAFSEYDLINGTYPNTIRVAADGHIGEKKCHVILLGVFFVFIEDDPEFSQKIDQLKNKKVLIWDHDKNAPALPIILLTATGKTIMELMEDNSFNNAQKLIQIIGQAGLKSHLMVKDSIGGLVKIG